MSTHIPSAQDLGSFSGCERWIVVSRVTGLPVLELDNRDAAYRINHPDYYVLTAAQWLARRQSSAQVGTGR